jgi:hypothetical protein
MEGRKSWELVTPRLALEAFRCRPRPPAGGSPPRFEARIVGLVDVTHAAHANGRKDFIRAEFIACGKLHVLDSAKYLKLRTKRLSKTTSEYAVIQDLCAF